MRLLGPGGVPPYSPRGAPQRRAGLAAAGPRARQRYRHGTMGVAICWL